MIRAAVDSDYPEMETLFRRSARSLCKEAYGEDVIEAWTGKYNPERFVESAKQGNVQYVLLEQ